MSPFASISVVVPACDEEAGIAEVVHDIAAFLGPFGLPFEIIVVDDGSTDRTAAVVNDITAAEARVKLVRHDRNRGKGAAIVSGLRQAASEWVLLLDADGQIGCDELIGIDAASGDTVAYTGVRRRWRGSCFRTIVSIAYNTLARRLLGFRFRDVNCPFKLFRNGMIDPAALQTDGFSVDAEMLAILTRKGHVIEVPVRHADRRTGTSKVVPAAVCKSLVDLLRLRHRYGA